MQREPVWTFLTLFLLQSAFSFGFSPKVLVPVLLLRWAAGFRAVAPDGTNCYHWPGCSRCIIGAALDTWMQQIPLWFTRKV